MSVEGEICAYVRGCKDKGLAIELAASIFDRSRVQIVSALQSFGLLDENERYIEPVRLTGKEVAMEKEKRKINYPSFAWSPKRQKILAELYQADTPVLDIAAHFEIDEDAVYKAISKYNLVRVARKEEPELPVAYIPTAPDVEADDSAKELDEIMKMPPLLAQFSHDVEYIQKRVTDALLMMDEIMEYLTNNNERDGYFVLGQLQGLLFELKRLIKAEG